MGLHFKFEAAGTAPEHPTGPTYLGLRIGAGGEQRTRDLLHLAARRHLDAGARNESAQYISAASGLQPAKRRGIEAAAVGDGTKVPLRHRIDQSGSFGHVIRSAVDRMRHAAPALAQDWHHPKAQIIPVESFECIGWVVHPFQSVMSGVLLDFKSRVNEQRSDDVASRESRLSRHCRET